MKKRIISLAMSVCMLLFGAGLPAFAATAPTKSADSGVHVMLVNTDSMITRLTFSGDRSDSIGIIRGKDGTCKIKADVYLMQVRGNTQYTVKHWTESTNSDTLEFSNYYYVSSGYDYVLEIDAAVTRNGSTEYISDSVRGHCD